MRSGRHPLALISTANNPTDRPFLRPNELTPASSGSSSRAVSPMSPALDPRQSMRTTNRSMTSPLPRSPRPPSPPSPGISNLDCAFPPFPRSVSRATSRSPKADTRGLMAAFEQNFGQNQNNANATGSFSRSRGQSISNGAGRNRGDALPSSIDPIQRPATAGSNRRRPSVAGTVGGSQMGEGSAPPLPALPAWSSRREEETTAGQGEGKSSFGANARRPARIGGYGGLGDDVHPSAPTNPYASPQGAVVASPVEEKDPWQEALPHRSHIADIGQTKKDPSRRPPPLAAATLQQQGQEFSPPLPSPTRSQTFPRQHEARSSHDGPNRRPSEPASRLRKPSLPPNPRPTGIEPSKQGYQAYKPANLPPLSPGRFPPRKDSRPGLRPGFGSQNDSEKPPMPGNIFTEDLDIGNPYHTPSDSASSNGSEISAVPTASTHSSVSLSPPRPTRGHRMLNGSQSSLEIPPVPPLRFGATGDSPTDPLFQQGRLSPIPPLDPVAAPSSPRKNSHDPLRRPPTRSGTSKGQCRGCSNMILAGEKSVSSADGRLTGRYHKSCFACHVCRSAFATADFYVLHDSPYCAKHYHEANGSLCYECGEGIEGQYLEPDVDDTTTKASSIRRKDKSKKFHPACFTCTTCKVMLNEDYFVWAGKTYCERDAFVAAGMGPSPINRPNTGTHARANSSGSLRAPRPRPNGFLAPNVAPPGGGLGSGRKFPERRTTKLMMI